MFESDKPVPKPNNSLKDPASWVKPKTWIVPLQITVMVDDPSKYDFEMKKLIDKVLNELRGITRNFDRSGKQLSVDYGDPVKDPDKWEVLSSGEASSKTLESQILATLEKLKQKEQPGEGEEKK